MREMGSQGGSSFWTGEECCANVLVLSRSRLGEHSLFLLTLS